jgi:hypothetical protein
VATSGAISPGKAMAKKAALEVIAKGRLHMEWDTAVKIISMIKVGQISFQILSRDLMQ